MPKNQIWAAHINENTNKIQTVKEHSENTAKLCCDFAIPQMKELMYAIGLFHDIGKYQHSFQKKINNDLNLQVEHSTCGALAVKEYYPNAIKLIMEYCIAGHHSGIPDAGNKNDTPDKPTLYGRMQRKFEDFSKYQDELTLPVINEGALFKFFLEDCETDSLLFVDKFAFWTRYCFSCLVDADSLDTAEFCDGNTARPMKTDFLKCLDKVNKRLDSFICKTRLQKARAVLQKQVFAKTEQDAEIYLMNMPTGSGKTLASIKFSLERVIRKNKKRIIYIIPYNSIIDQVAGVFEELFGEDAEILRHQSTFSYEDADINEDYRNAVKKASENWDAPLIITTAVQFFQSIYDNKRTKLRKLHNMADSILIFDEAHLMPQEYLQPCLRGIAYITRYLNSEAVFLTATMPDFPQLMKKYTLKNSKIIHLIEDTSFFSEFYKCSFSFLGKLSDEAILMKAGEYSSCLIIVNRKKDAKQLFTQCKGKRYHLSTYMTAYDRKKILDEIRRELNLLEKFQEENHLVDREIPEERRIIIISTSLIEAGVDLDVHTVFREVNGLDNILQSGGRCNREGKRENAQTFIFERIENGKQISEDERKNIVKGLLEKYSDISCPACIKEYYERLFILKDAEIRKKMITQMCSSIDSLPFREYAENFKLIDSRTISVVVPRDDNSKKLVESLQYAKSTSGIARKLQKYVCSVHQKELDDLISQHVIDDFGTGIYCLTNSDYYDEETGIGFEAKDYLIE